jgi:hypothetical protein
MTDQSLTAPAQATSVPAGGLRTDFLDHVRLLLTALVLVHHCAVMFGAPGGWYLKMPSDQLAERIVLTMLVSIDQSFFMGFFFLLAGYFTVTAYDRKGPLPFLRDRLIRLGLPLLVYGYVLGPMTVALAGVARGAPFLATWTAMMRRGEFEVGPLWFALALLLFSFAYAGWRMLARHAARDARFAPRPAHLLAAAIGTGAGAFLLRLWVPVGQERWLLQVGYFASYIVLFVAGCAVARSRWLEQVDASTARPWKIVAWISAPMLFIYGVAAGAARGVPFDTAGGWTLPALAYAFWEPFVAWGIILSLLACCRRSAPQHASWSRWTGSAYAAYILHAPVAVGLGVLLADAALPNAACFVLASGGGIVLSFLLARLSIAIPGVRRVL